MNVSVRLLLSVVAVVAVLWIGSCTLVGPVHATQDVAASSLDNTASAVTTQGESSSLSVLLAGDVVGRRGGLIGRRIPTSTSIP